MTLFLQAMTLLMAFLMAMFVSTASGLQSPMSIFVIGFPIGGIAGLIMAEIRRA